MLLIDDDAAWVAPEQEAQHTAIAEYDHYLVRGADTELPHARSILEARLDLQPSGAG